MTKSKIGLMLAGLAMSAPSAMIAGVRNENKAVAKKAATGVGTLNFEGDVGAGMEGADKDSYAIPFLRVLQSTSPQVNEARGEYIEGAKPGMLLNTATRKIYDGKEGLVLLPCAFQRRFIRWAPRGDSNGFKGELLPEDVNQLEADGMALRHEGRLYALDEKGETPHEKTTDTLSDTRSHFCIVCDEDGHSQALLALTSTQIKKSKQLMSLLSAAKVETSNGKVTPPTWMNKVRITTVHESNDEGDWYGVMFTGEGFIEQQDLYDAGKAFYEAVSEGKAKADHNADAAESSSESSGKF